MGSKQKVPNEWVLISCKCISKWDDIFDHVVEMHKSESGLGGILAKSDGLLAGNLESQISGCPLDKIRLQWYSFRNSSFAASVICIDFVETEYAILTHYWGCGSRDWDYVQMELADHIILISFEWDQVMECMRGRIASFEA